MYKMLNGKKNVLQRSVNISKFKVYNIIYYLDHSILYRLGFSYLGANNEFNYKNVPKWPRLT